MKINKPDVSVIIPIYNASQYLEKCLQSIIKQSYDNFEIILINDKSPDAYDDLICQKYADEYQQIVYIKHHQNLGAGGARNTGIKKAKAEYITFIDSDDFIAVDLVKTCYEEMITNNRDVVVFNYQYIDENLNILHTSSFNSDTSGDLLKNFLDDNHTIDPAVWGKMWKKALFLDNNIEFTEGVYHEDMTVTPLLLYYTKNMIILDHVFYFYLRRQGSIVNSSSKKHIDDIFIVSQEISKFLQSIGRLDFYKESLNARTWNMIRYYIKTGLKGTSFKRRKEILSYLANKVVSENLTDINYYFPHRYY